MARAHVLRIINDVLRRALDFELVGRRERERPKMTWRKQVNRLNIIILKTKKRCH